MLSGGKLGCSPRADPEIIEIENSTERPNFSQDRGRDIRAFARFSSIGLPVLIDLWIAIPMPVRISGAISSDEDLRS